jgi:sulfur carrier protein ThiS
LPTLKPIGFLADLIHEQELIVQIQHPIKLRELISAQLPEEKIIILINQKKGTLDSYVNNEDNVLILPIISGG